MNEAISRIVGEVYDAASAPELWPRSMASIMGVLETEAAYVLVQQRQLRRAELVAGAGINPEYMHVFNERYIECSPCLKAVRNAEVLAVGMSGFERTEFFNEFLEPQNVYWGLMGRLSLDEREVWCFSASRRRAASPFGRREIDVLGVVLPHLRRAFFLQRQLAGARAARLSAEAALDVLAHGVILLDVAGRVQHCNASGKRLLDRKQGLLLSKGSFLVAENRTESARLDALLRAAVGDRKSTRVGGSIALSRKAQEQALSVIVAPLGAEHNPLSSFGAAAVVFVSDPDERSPGIEARLSSLYGLSPAESRVAMALIEGHDPARVSELLHVSLPTIRTHLRSIFRRTGTRGQSDLVRLLLRSPQVLSTP